MFFYAKYSANSLRASALRVGGGKIPLPAPTPLVGPTNLQILAMPLPQKLYEKVWDFQQAHGLEFLEGGNMGV